jgi:F0F1-type ATP synthase assembly protein I
MADEHRDDKIQSAAILWARYSEIAFIIPAAIVVGWVVGKLLDRWLHTHWLLIAGVIVGAILGFVQMIRMVSTPRE